jgi:hypothetical protein
MLLQTNSYIVPKDKRAEHARLLRRFRASLAKLGCDSFEVYEQVGSNWTTGEPTGRYVQIMRFRDRRHQVAVQAAERNDPVAQAIIAEFCQLINFPYQQQQGLFAVGFYNSVLPVAPSRPQAADAAAAGVGAGEGAVDSHAEVDQAAGAPEDLAEGPIDEVALGGDQVAEAHAGADAGAHAEADVPVEAAGEESAGGTNGNADDVGSLLDTHVEPAEAADANGDAGHSLAEMQGPGDEAPDGLDAIDLDPLDMPDDASPESQPASKHVAH